MTLHKAKVFAGLSKGIAIAVLCAAPIIASAGPIGPHYGWQFRGGDWQDSGNQNNSGGDGGQYGQNGDNGNGNGDGGDGGNGGNGGSWGNGGDGGDGGNGDCPPPNNSPGDPSGVPEPATWALALAGLMGLFAARQRRSLAGKVRS